MTSQLAGILTQPTTRRLQTHCPVTRLTRHLPRVWPQETPKAAQNRMALTVCLIPYRHGIAIRGGVADFWRGAKQPRPSQGTCNDDVLLFVGMEAAIPGSTENIRQGKIDRASPICRASYVSSRDGIDGLARASPRTK